MPLVNKLKELDPALALSYQVCSDTHGPLFTVSKDGGLVLIAGTGSMARVLHSSGFSSRASGWGHLVGDEGSAYYVVKTAIELIHKQQDGILPLSEDVRVRDLDTSAAAHKLNRYFGTKSVEEVNQRLYKKFEKDKIAGFCEELAHLACRGDRLSCYLFEEAGAHLARMFVALLPSYIHVLDTDNNNGSGDGSDGEVFTSSTSGGGSDGEVHVKILCVGSMWKSWSLMQASFTEVAARGLQRSTELYPHTYRRLLPPSSGPSGVDATPTSTSANYFGYGTSAAPAAAEPLTMKIVCELLQSTETGAVGAALLAARSSVKEAEEAALEETAAEAAAREEAMAATGEGAVGEGSVGDAPGAGATSPAVGTSPSQVSPSESPRTPPMRRKAAEEDLFTPPRYKGRRTAPAPSTLAPASSTLAAPASSTLAAPAPSTLAVNGKGHVNGHIGGDSVPTSPVLDLLVFPTAAREAAAAVVRQVSAFESSIDHDAMSTRLHELAIEVTLPLLDEEEEDEGGDEEEDEEDEHQKMTPQQEAKLGDEAAAGVEVEGGAVGDGDDGQQLRRRQTSPSRHSVSTPNARLLDGRRRLDQDLLAIERERERRESRERERREKGVLTTLPTTLTQALTQALVAGARITPAEQPPTWSQQATFGAATLVAGLITAIALSPARPSR
jgi:hypothetical protein